MPAQESNAMLRGRSSLRTTPSVFRRVERPSSRAPRLRRPCSQPARRGERLSQVGFKLVHESLQSDRAQPVRRGGRPPRFGSKLTFPEPAIESTKSTRKPIRRGGRPQRLRRSGLAAALKLAMGLNEYDARACERWLLHNEVGMTDINQLGMLDIIDIAELAKGLSKVGGKVVELTWFKLRAQIFRFVCSHS